MKKIPRAAPDYSHNCIIIILVITKFVKLYEKNKFIIPLFTLIQFLKMFTNYIPPSITSIDVTTSPRRHYIDLPILK